MAIPGYPEHSVEFKYATEHRCGVKVSGPRLSHRITGNDPLKDYKLAVKCEATPMGNEDSKFTAELVNVLSDEITRQLL